MWRTLHSMHLRLTASLRLLGIFAVFWLKSLSLFLLWESRLGANYTCDLPMVLLTSIRVEEPVADRPSSRAAPECNSQSGRRRPTATRSARRSPDRSRLRRRADSS